MEHGEESALSYEAELDRTVRLYADSLLRTCCVYLRDSAQAEDVVQEVFIRAWKNRAILHALDEPKRKAWLVKTSVNLCHDFYRSGWFRHINHRVTPDDLPMSSGGMPPGDQTLLSDVVHLPEKYKQVVLLYYYQEMTLREAAQILGVSAAAVHKRLEKARELLKKGLTGRDSDESESSETGD